ncbi:hypothetical protein GGF40_003615 [Coemansia sp. RSA 1286]|nr:hypothetical protein GGF40_003615 [Coemansia sp. RSA 1286]
MSAHAGAPLDAAVAKRLQNELMTLMMANLTGISAFPSSDNMLNWAGTIEGAQGTVYEGLKYKLSPLNGPAAQLWENQEEYKRVLLKHYKEHAQ